MLADSVWLACVLFVLFLFTPRLTGKTPPQPLPLADSGRLTFYGLFGPELMIALAIEGAVVWQLLGG